MVMMLREEEIKQLMLAAVDDARTDGQRLDSAYAARVLIERNATLFQRHVDLNARLRAISPPEDPHRSGFSNQDLLTSHLADELSHWIALRDTVDGVISEIEGGMCEMETPGYY
jgi:hypothetical protein